MAPEVDNYENNNEMTNMRTITSLSFRTGKNSPDNDLMAAANEFASLPENQGISPTSLIRNFITRKLRLATEESRNKGECLRSAS